MICAVTAAGGSAVGPLQPLGDARPRVDPSAFVHPQSCLIGNVEVGARSSIWPMVVLRGDMGTITVGDETSIQDGSVVHLTEGWSHTSVGHRVTVGHRVILHGCRVEDGCLIGMGAIVLDNAVVGAGSLVGAGALVTAGTVIPPGSLVMGSPARVVRPVGDKERTMMEVGWRTYVDYAERYRAQARA